jgi:hypothetical protein
MILARRTDVPLGRVWGANPLVLDMREEMRSHAPLAKLADRQHGVVSHEQLLRLGFSKSAIGRLHGADRLCRIHRDVYAVGRADLSDHGRCMAAVLACGENAVLSHESAGWLWGLFPRSPVEVAIAVPRNGPVTSLPRTCSTWLPRDRRGGCGLVRKAGLPRPTMNFFIAGYEVDAYLRGRD